PQTAAVEFGELDELVEPSQPEPNQPLAMHSSERAADRPGESDAPAPAAMSLQPAADDHEPVASELEPVAAELTADRVEGDQPLTPYANIASILEATSIDCLSHAAADCCNSVTDSTPAAE